MGAAHIKEKNRPSPLWSRRWGYWDTCLPDWRIMTFRDAWSDQGKIKIFVTILKKIKCNLKTSNWRKATIKTKKNHRQIESRNELSKWKPNDKINKGGERLLRGSDKIRAVSNTYKVKHWQERLWSKKKRQGPFTVRSGKHCWKVKQILCLHIHKGRWKMPEMTVPWRKVNEKKYYWRKWKWHLSLCLEVDTNARSNIFLLQSTQL